MLLFVVAAAVFTHKELAVFALTLTIDQELEGLQAVYAVSVVQVTFIGQQFSFIALFFHLELQVPENQKADNYRFNQSSNNAGKHVTFFLDIL